MWSINIISLCNRRAYGVLHVRFGKKKAYVRLAKAVGHVPSPWHQIHYFRLSSTSKWRSSAWKINEEKILSEVFFCFIIVRGEYRYQLKCFLYIIIKRAWALFKVFKLTNRLFLLISSLSIIDTDSNTHSNDYHHANASWSTCINRPTKRNLHFEER